MVAALARICHWQIGKEEAVLSGVLFETIGDRARLRIREFVVARAESRRCRHARLSRVHKTYAASSGRLPVPVIMGG